MNALTLAEEIINGRRITREDDLSFFLTCDLEELCEGADKIREARIGDKVDLCSIINGRSGRCPEDCKYCAQSAHHHTNCEEYDFLPEEEILAMLYQHGCYFSTQRQVEDVKKEIRRLVCMTRCWDYKGHMASEVTRNAMSVGLGRKIYPNEPCPCGSGKKYKRCCGRKG